MDQIGTEAISKSKKVRERFSHTYIDWVSIKILPRDEILLDAKRRTIFSSKFKKVI